MIRLLVIRIYVLCKINWIQFITKYDKRSKNIIWLYPCFPGKLKDYLFGSSFEQDFALLNAVLKKRDSFRLVIGKLKYDTAGSNIFYNASIFFNDKNIEDHSKVLLEKLSELDKANNLLPSMDNIIYWENKLFMHEKFNELEIPHPKTFIVDDVNKAPKAEDLEFPILFKPAHASGSKGIEKINNIEQYREIVDNTAYQEYLIQSWIDMRRDLRLIYIGDELVVHYWRINNDSSWKPTSTSKGSSVDFNNLPDEWMDSIFKEYKKLNLKTAAFDITWNRDDLHSKPMFLEVSPSYMPNPKPPRVYESIPYSAYKKIVWSRDAYFIRYVKLVFELKMKLIDEYDRK